MPYNNKTMKNKNKVKSKSLKGGYDYLSSGEYLNASKLGNFRLLDRISNKTVNAYKPVISEANNNINDLLGELNLSPVEKEVVNNANRKQIQAILRDEESALIVKEVVELRNKLEEQSQNISDLVTDHLNISDYNSFLRNPSNKTKKFIFKNIDQSGDIPNDLTRLQNYGEKLMKVLPEIEGEEVNKKIKAEKEYIQYSISSAMSWKYVDLSKHAIGQLKDIMELAINLLDKEDLTPRLNDVDKNRFIYKIYSPYIEEKDRDEFFGSIRLDGFKVFFGENSAQMIIYDNDVSYVNVKTAKDYGGPPHDIKAMIGKALMAANSGIKTPNTDLAQEFLIVMIHELLGQTFKNLSNICEMFKDFQRRKYDNKYTQMYKNMKSNLTVFGDLIDNTINAFFNLDNRDISAYGIDLATLDDKAKASRVGRVGVRVIGGADKIKAKSRLTPENYPISVNSKEASVDKLVNMFSYAPKLDIVTKKPLAMGGFIQKEFIGRMSIKIVHDYFENLLKQKDANIKYIDGILDKMRRGVHVKDLKTMRSKIEQRLKEIGKISDRTSKLLRAKASGQAIGNEYKRLRNYELDNLLSLDMIETTIRNNPEKMATVGKEIMKLRDEAFTKFAHYQLKSHAYKTLALGVYQELSQLNPQQYPPEFMGILQEAFGKQDQKLIEELTQKSPQKAERLRGRLLNRIVGQNVAIVNSATGKNVRRNLPMKNEYISNVNTTLTATDWKRIESKEYWERVKKALDGLSVYVLYVDISILDLGHQHGLFNLIDSAISGQIKEGRVLSSLSNDIIPGSRLDRKAISRYIRAKGKILVTNGEREINNINLWRCMLKSDINKMKKLGEADLRRKIFNILASKAAYQENTPYLIPNSSMTKQRLILYCEMKMQSIY